MNTGWNRGSRDRPSVGRGYRSDSNQIQLFGIAEKLLALVFLLCASCQGTPTHTVPVVAETPNYLDVGDQVRITIPAVPELNQSQKIGADGSLSLPLVGEIHAAGKVRANCRVSWQTSTNRSAKTVRLLSLWRPGSPPGCRQLAVFARSSLLTYRFRYARRFSQRVIFAGCRKS